METKQLVQQTRSLITPFELFSSILGGITIVIAVLLLYKPIVTFDGLYLFLMTGISLKEIIFYVFLSYFAGSLTGSLTFSIYKLIEKKFKLNSNYYNINTKIVNNYIKKRLILSQEDFFSLEYVDRVAYLLSRKTNITESFYRCIISIIPYIRKNDPDAIRYIDNHIAQHIMQRGLSLGFLLIALVTAYNIGAQQEYSLSSFAFLMASVIASIVSFKKCHNHIRWHRREILNSFYNLAANEYYPADKEA